MKCPSCESELVVIGQARLETICEHVCDPNGIPSMKNEYKCSNISCDTHLLNISWNKEGELYCGVYDSNIDICYIGDNDGPFGTISRRFNVELYKNGVKDKTELFEVFGYKFTIRHKYTADEDGNVLSKGYKLEIWRRDKEGRYYTSWTSGFMMIFYKIRRFNQDWKFLKDVMTDKTRIYEPSVYSRMIESVEGHYTSYDKRWWSLFSIWIMKNLFWYRRYKINRYKKLV